MGRLLVLLYGVFAYVCFLGTFLYAIGFVGGIVVPKAMNTGEASPLSSALLVNLAFLGVFGIQHSIMARPAFKAVWTKIIPASIERSTFVLLTCIILSSMFWQWRPIHATVWQVDQSWARMLLMGISFGGWVLVLYSSFLIDHFDLFGLRQVWLYFQGKEYTQSTFVLRSIYKLVRHPLMLGFIVAFWATPDMTQGHLLFAGVTTAYVLVAIQIEERDLISAHGEDYRAYRRTTRMLLPIPKG